MDTYLLAHHKRHFIQGYGNPFTIHPLQTLIIENGPTQFLSKLEKTEINVEQIKVSNFTKDILQLLTQNYKDLPQLKYDLTTQQVKQGYKIWSEKTFTSPERRYLSLYKV
eukprot:8704653-Ditylum_brightwellii.AAC.1